MLLDQRSLLSPLPVRISLEYTAHRGPPPSPPELFRLSSVRSLTITDHIFGYTHRLLRALSTPRDLEDGSREWPWPSLVEVTVESLDSISMILRHMVKLRTEAASLQREIRGRKKIATLERLEVGADTFTPEELEAIRAVLGNVAVVIARDTQ
ncbi:hypothetical protein FRB93_012876 [Tulasnella sp. JGI-2019a]|nr:hypothetical protein FRB93_012876 [Tulasnella sp. JGI-2019a]